MIAVRRSEAYTLEVETEKAYLIQVRNTAAYAIDVVSEEVTIQQVVPSGKLVGFIPG